MSEHQSTSGGSSGSGRRRRRRRGGRGRSRPANTATEQPAFDDSGLPLGAAADEIAPPPPDPDEPFVKPAMEDLYHDGGARRHARRARLPPAVRASGYAPHPGRRLRRARPGPPVRHAGRRHRGRGDRAAQAQGPESPARAARPRSAASSRTSITSCPSGTTSRSSTPRSGSTSRPAPTTSRCASSTCSARSASASAASSSRRRVPARR